MKNILLAGNDETEIAKARIIRQALMFTTRK